mmetsp:Transcript_3183/g.5956  ORF Transcript_3183/g.5956 Transcript_3183/m.5956 type:complete len:142 (+) Transcript_3183:366-791(+)
MQSNHGEIDSINCWIQLKATIQSNLSWHPTIYIKSTHFYHPKCPENGVTPKDVCVLDKAIDHDPQLVNVALFLDVSISASATLSHVRSKQLGYPPNAVLEIENFHGLEQEANVITALNLPSIYKPCTPLDRSSQYNAWMMP